MKIAPAIAPYLAQVIGSVLLTIAIKSCLPTSKEDILFGLYVLLYYACALVVILPLTIWHIGTIKQFTTKKLIQIVLLLGATTNLGISISMPHYAYKVAQHLTSSGAPR